MNFNTHIKLVVAVVVGISLYTYKSSAQCTVSIVSPAPVGKRYEVISNCAKNWASASSDAVSRGGRLLEINSSAEYDTIRTYLQSITTSSYPTANDGGGVRYVWTGGRRGTSTNQGNFYWDGRNISSTTSQFWQGNVSGNRGSTFNSVYQNFGNQEPDNYTDATYSPSGQKSVAIGLAGWPAANPGGNGNAYQWNDLNDADILNYIVEYPLNNNLLITTGILSPAGVGSTGSSGNLILWLDGRDINGNGTNPTVNSSVQTWTDKSGRRNNATQSTPANQATFISLTNNGGGLLFDGSNDNYPMGTSGLPTGTSARSLFIVAHTNDISTSGYRHILAYADNTSTASKNFGFGKTFDNKVGFFGWANDVNPDNANTNIHLFHANMVSGTAKYNFDNDVRSDATGLNTGSGVFRLGNNRVGTEHWQGSIREAILYNRIVNVAEQNIIANYLSAKYNFSITNDFYTMDNPGNGNLDFNVAGIGRAGSATDTLRISRGTGIVTISSAGISNTNSYFLWGDNNLSTTINTNRNVRIRDTGYFLMERRYGFNNINNIGQITISFEVPNPSAAYRLLISSAIDTSFTTLPQNIVAIKPSIVGTSRISFVYNPSITTGVFVLSQSLLKQSITFPAIISKAITDNPFLVGATTDSFLPLTYSSSNTYIASIQSDTIAINGAGTTVIKVSQSGNTQYDSASVSQILRVDKLPQTISFTNISPKTFGDTPFLFTASTNSGLALSYYSSDTKIAIYTSGSITILQSGSTSITVFQSGNSIYDTASVSQTLFVSKQQQNIVWNPPSQKTYGDPNFFVSYTNSSPLSLAFSSSNTNIVQCVNGINQIKITGVGSVTITAYNYGDINYIMKDTTFSLTVVKGNQSISLPQLRDRSTSEGIFLMDATSTSGLPISYSSSDPSVASINGASITITSVGTCTITAIQTGNSNYNPALSVSRTLRVVNNTVQVITFDNETTNSKIYGANKNIFALKYTANSTLLISFSSSSTIAQIFSSLGKDSIRILSTGSTFITAFNTGDATYNPLNQSFLLYIDKGRQTVLFSIDPTTYGASPLVVPQNSDVNLPLIYSTSNTRVISINGNTLTLIGAGEALITAYNTGNIGYYPVEYSQNLSVSQKTLHIFPVVESDHLLGHAGPIETFTYSGFVTGDNQNNSLSRLPTPNFALVDTFRIGTYTLQIDTTGLRSSKYSIVIENTTYRVVEGNTTIGGTSLENLVLWLDGRDIHGNGNAVIPYSSVSQWRDKSGRGNHAMIHSSGLGSTLADPLGGFYFDRTNQEYFEVPSLQGFSSGERTIIAVLKNNITSGDEVALSYAVPQSGNGFFLGKNNSNNYFTGAYSGTDINTSIAANTFEILSLTEDGNNNGTDIKIGDSFSSGYENYGFNTSVNSPFRIGAEIGTAQKFWNGNIYEVLFFNTVLRQIDYNILLNNLSAKYNTLLTSKDFYILDNLNRGNFDYNVAGIGIDTDGETLITSKGTGILRVSVPLVSGDEKYFIWGDNNENATIPNSTTNIDGKSYYIMHKKYGFQQYKANSSEIFHNFTFHFSIPNLDTTYRLIISKNQNFENANILKPITVSNNQIVFSTSINSIDTGYFVLGKYSTISVAQSSTGTTTNIGNVNNTFHNIRFSSLPHRTYGNASFRLTGSVSSEIPILFSSSNTAIASVFGDSIRINGAGTTHITAYVNTNDFFVPVTHTLRVFRQSLNILVDNKQKIQTNPNPLFTYSYNGFVNNDLFVNILYTPTLFTTPANPNVNGNYTISVDTTTNGGWTANVPNYKLTSITTGTLEVLLPTPTVTNGPAGVDITGSTSNLILWLDGRDINGNGINPAASSSVATWTDKSGRGNNATQSISANQAIFISLTNNGGGLLFDGSNDNYPMGTSGLPTGTSARSLFIVAHTNDISTSGYRHILAYGDNAGTGNKNFGFGKTFDNKVGFFGWGNDVNPDNANTNIHLFHANMVSGTAKYNFDNNVRSDATGLNTGSGVFRLGNNRLGGRTLARFY